MCSWTRAVASWSSTSSGSDCSTQRVCLLKWCLQKATRCITRARIGGRARRRARLLMYTHARTQVSAGAREQLHHVGGEQFEILTGRPAPPESIFVVRYCIHKPQELAVYGGLLKYPRCTHPCSLPHSSLTHTHMPHHVHMRTHTFQRGQKRRLGPTHHFHCCGRSRIATVLEERRGSRL